ncbi:Hypothetical predicted protein [Lecanosticta acicola]|uniref:Uncharacterized protein n=1 Tax=Lecanosticta acicola TaxID=111012 RepID=A0AAI8Z5Q6_9PEZI|nr:Hypothetical predicted protein [Lecanosticta acicola]
MTTTNEPTRSYCNLSHEDMQSGSKHICWSPKVQNLMYQFCAFNNISEHCLPGPRMMVTLLQYIDFDTEDEDALRNATSKVITWIQSHVKPAVMNGNLREVSSAPGKKMADWSNSFSAFSKTWMGEKYNVIGNGMMGGDTTMEEWKAGEWRSKAICVDQTVAWKRAYPKEVYIQVGGAPNANAIPGHSSAGPAPVFSVPVPPSAGATPAAGPSSTGRAAVSGVPDPSSSANPIGSAQVPLPGSSSAGVHTSATPVAPHPQSSRPTRVVINSHFQDFVVNEMLKINPGWTKEGMEEWINTEAGMKHMVKTLMGGNTDVNLAKIKKLEQKVKQQEQALRTQQDEAAEKHQSELNRKAQEQENAHVSIRAQMEDLSKKHQSELSRLTTTSKTQIANEKRKMQNQIADLEAQVMTKDKEYNKLSAWATESYKQTVEMEKEINELKARRGSDSSSLDSYDSDPGFFPRAKTAEIPLSPRPTTDTSQQQPAKLFAPKPIRKNSAWFTSKPVATGGDSEAPCYPNLPTATPRTFANINADMPAIPRSLTNINTDKPVTPRSLFTANANTDKPAAPTLSFLDRLRGTASTAPVAPVQKPTTSAASTIAELDAKLAAAGISI